MIDPINERMILTEILLRTNGEYEPDMHTGDVFATEWPYPVILDLPALTARRAVLEERAES